LHHDFGPQLLKSHEQHQSSYELTDGADDSVGEEVFGLTVGTGSDGAILGLAVIFDGLIDGNCDSVGD